MLLFNQDVFDEIITGTTTTWYTAALQRAAWSRGSAACSRVSDWYPSRNESDRLPRVFFGRPTLGHTGGSIVAEQVP